MRAAGARLLQTAHAPPPPLVPTQALCASETGAWLQLSLDTGRAVPCAWGVGAPAARVQFAPQGACVAVSLWDGTLIVADLDNAAVHFHSRLPLTVRGGWAHAAA